MGQNRDQEVVTFKADAALVEAMRGIPNRSEFIRGAILAALRNTCPLCAGTGTLTEAQRHHWQAFSRRHRVRVCPECRAIHLVCTGTANTGDATPGTDSKETDS